MVYHNKSDVSTTDSTVRQWNLHPTLQNAVQDLSLEPTALLTTVLTRTTTDFADVLVDGRCATGSSTVGTATAIWQHNSNALNIPGGHSLPLYKTPVAIHERQVLVTLYAAHCLLINLNGGGKTQRGGAGGSGGRVVEVGILLAASDSSVGTLHAFAKGVCSRCGIEVSLVSRGESLSKALEGAIKLRSVGKAPAEGALSAFAAENNNDGAVVGILVVDTLKNFLGWDSGDFTRVLVAHQHDENVGASVESERSREITSGGSGVVPHIAALAAEDIGGLHPGTADETAWHAILGAMLAAAERAHTRSASATHLLPHFMWLCLGPLSSLSPLVRSRLSRRSRRHYPLHPNNYISSSSASLAFTGPGTTSPMENIHMRYLLYLNEKDREEQLRMILKQTHAFRRSLLLTHHKDIRQLSAKIQTGGFYDSTNPDPALATSTDSTAGNATTSPSALNQINVPEGRQFYLLRSDAPERQHNLLLSFTQSKSQESVLLIGWDTCTAVDLMDIDVLIQYYPPQKSLTEQEWAEFIQILHTTGDSELKIESALRANPNNSEQHIKLKVAQLRVGLSTSSPLISSRCRQSPVVVTFIGNSDFSLCAHFMQQYHYSGGTGALSSAAAAALLSAVTTAPGQPGVWLPSPDAARVPVLNICASHPLFPLLVTAQEEGGGSPTRPPPAGMEDPVTLRNVLRVKLQKEREALAWAGPRNANANPNSSARPGGAHAMGTYNIMNSVLSMTGTLNPTAATGSGGGGNTSSAAPKGNLSPQPSNGAGVGALANTSNGSGLGGGQSSRKSRRGNRNNRRRGSSDRKTPGAAADAEQDKSFSSKPTSSLPIASGGGGASRREPTNDLSGDKSGSSNDNASRLNRDGGGSQRQLKSGTSTRRGGKRKSRSDITEDQPQDKQLGGDQYDSGPKKDGGTQKVGNNVPQQESSIAAFLASAVVTESTGAGLSKQDANSNLGAASKKKMTAHVVGGMLEKIGVKVRVEPSVGI